MANRVVWTFFAKDKFSAIAKRIKDNTAKMKKQFKSLNQVMEKTSKKMKKIGNSMKRISVAASVAVIGSLKAFSDMEKGVTNVLTLLNEKEIDKFGGAIDKLATESLTKFGFNTEETTQALFNNVSALGANEKSFAAFEAAQKLAIGGVTTLDTAVSGIAAVMNAYGDAAGDATEVANAFFAAQKKGTTDVTKLASNIGQVAPLAKNMGIGFKELLATMAQLTQGGLSTEEATTSLKGVLSALQRPTGEAEKLFTKLGIPFGVTAVRGEGLAKTLLKIAEVSKKQPDLIAKLIPNIRALIGVSSLSADAIGKIQDTIESMNEDQLSPAFQKQMETFSRATALLKGNLVAMGITIGSNIAPAFLFMANKIRILIDWFNGFSDTTKKWISFGLLFVAILAPIIISLAVMMTVLAGIGAAFGAIFGFIFTVPVAIAAAIIAAGTAIFLWWDDIKALGKKVANFFGFGSGDLDAELNGAAAELATSSKAEVAIGITTPKGTTATMKTTTSGNTPNLDVATNLVGES